MKQAFTLIVYMPMEVNISQKESIVMLKNVIYEILGADIIEPYDHIVHILCDERNEKLLTSELESFSNSVSFHFICDTYEDMDAINHHLNTHLQRAAVSTDVNYLLLISGSLPIFSNQIFSDSILWDKDINIGISQRKNSSLIIFKRQFTPFFFRLSDTHVKTGERSVILFQQYKRDVNIIEIPSVFELDKLNESDFEFIKNQLKQGRNIHQIELFRLVESG